MIQMQNYFSHEQLAMIVIAGVHETWPPLYLMNRAAAFMAMSEVERTKMKADLQAQWDALPQMRKDQIENSFVELSKPRPLAPPPTPPQSHSSVPAH